MTGDARTSARRNPDFGLPCPGDRLAGRFAPATLRAAWWTLLSLWRARRVLKADGLRARIPPPPPLPAKSGRGVRAVLRRTDSTCLERATVLQTWLASQDRAVDIVVGVASRKGKVIAHAWIDEGHRPPDTVAYHELVRIPPPILRAPPVPRRRLIGSCEAGQESGPG